jgi:hypothetical protein
MEVTPEVLTAKFWAIFPHLDERQRRLLMGAEARALGHGGIRLVARAAGVREATVSAGAGELEAGAGPLAMFIGPLLHTGITAATKGRYCTPATASHAAFRESVTAP